MSPHCEICDRKLGMQRARLCGPCRARLLHEQQQDCPAALDEGRALAQRLRRMNPWSRERKRA